MDRDPIVGDQVRNKQSGELGRVQRVTSESCWCFFVVPDDRQEPPYWEAAWNLEVVEPAIS